VFAFSICTHDLILGSCITLCTEVS